MMNKKLQAVVSQRLKLAKQDMRSKSLAEVLNAVIGQNRNMTPEEVEQECSEIRHLFAKSCATVKRVKEDRGGYFSTKIHSMNLTKDELAIWTNRVGSRLLDMELSGDVAAGGFLPDTVHQELQQLRIALSDGSETAFSEEHLEELLTYSMLVTSLLSIHEPPVAQCPVSSENGMETTSEGTAAIKAVQLLRDEGVLPAYWEGIPGDNIKDLFNIVRQDNTLQKSNAALLDKLTEELVKGYVQNRKENAQPVYELDEEDLKARHLLATATLRNLKATNMLPTELEDVDDETLALFAYTNTELNFYFDKAAAGKLSFDAFWDIACNLLEAAFFGLLTFVALCTPGTGAEKVLGVIMGLVAVASVCEAVDVFLNEVFPAGVKETRLGRTIKATVDKVKSFAAELLKKLTGNGEPPHNPPVPEDEDGEDEDETETDNEDEEDESEAETIAENEGEW